ncbi:CRAL-TRIO domain-containing protein [Suillus fuscotomentosus]|uniref:CRAL-TRIO domain-containing protein n=1 Tax=Suillus fuscotomentosus TaxID=1912939 RepID=A0AAD4HFM4_9AGAM|nr:CRAL-TRIO domain-containing protein [Suillus fuscotomentosus]KAG1895875.1 CRAL-TRIO domain-containing protein [Suillus fuscotomentosus]
MSTLEQASASPMPDGITDPNFRPMPGRVGNLTVPQQHALQTLKNQLHDEGHFVEERMDDPMLLRPTVHVRLVVQGVCTDPVCRYLRARKFDVPKAKAMLLAAEQWRRDMKVDDIVQSFVFTEKEQVDQYYPQYYHKMDKDGRPVYIERLGKLNVPALYGITTKERLLQRLILEYERFLTDRLPACSAAVGHPVETVCTILDLKGVSLSSFYQVRDYVNEASKIGQDRYPECMGKFYIINAPWGFSAVWSLIKPWLDEVTVSKIEILGSSYQQKLLQDIRAEDLPADLGGKCRCAGGCSLSDAGPWNPNEKTGNGVA